MGIIIRTNVDASNYANKMISAVTRGLQLIVITNTSKERLTTDFSVVSNTSLGIVGTPIITNTDTQFMSLHNYITTNIIDNTIEFSAALVARTEFGYLDAQIDNAHRALMFGNYINQEGIVLGYQASSGTLSFARRVILADSTSYMLSASMPNSINITSFALYNIKYTSLNKLYANNITENYYYTSTQTNVLHPTFGTNVHHIGNSGASGYKAQEGSCYISQLRYANVAWTDDEFAIVNEEMRRYELLHNNRVV
jgi:hypothetical protein